MCDSADEVLLGWSGMRIVVIGGDADELVVMLGLPRRGRAGIVALDPHRADVRF